MRKSLLLELFTETGISKVIAHPLRYPLTDILTHPRTRRLTYSVTHSLINLLTHPLIHSPTRFSIHALIHLLTHNPTRLLTHPLTLLPRWRRWRLMWAPSWTIRSTANSSSSHITKTSSNAYAGMSLTSYPLDLSSPTQPLNVIERLCR